MLTIHNVGDGVSRMAPPRMMRQSSLSFSALVSVTRGVAFSRGGYFPGVVTAPPLLLFAAWLAVLQTREAGWPSGLLS